MHLDRSKNIMKNTVLDHIRISRSDVMGLISAISAEYPEAIGIIVCHGGITVAEHGKLKTDKKISEMIRDANHNGHYILVEKDHFFVPRL